MKYIIVLGDGMADEPIEKCRGRHRLKQQINRRWTDLQKVR